MGYTQADKRINSETLPHEWKMREVIFYRDAHSYYNSREVGEENLIKRTLHIL